VTGLDVVTPSAELVGTGPGGGRDGVGPQMALNAAPEVYRAFTGGVTRTLPGMRALN